MHIKPVHWMLAAAFQMTAALAQAATVSVPVGGAIPLQGVAPGFQPQVQAGTTKLTWSNGQVDPNVPASNSGSVKGSVAGSNTAKIVDTGTGHYEEYKSSGTTRYKVLESDEYSVQSIQMDDSSGQFQKLTLTGASKKIASFISGTLTGGDIDVSNVRVDLAGGRLIMDLAADPSPYTDENGQTIDPPSFSSVSMTAFTFSPANMSGPTGLKPQDVLLSGTARDAALQASGFVVGANGAVQAVNLIKRLDITPEAKQFTAEAFGFGPTAINALDSIDTTDPNGYGWGWLQVTSNFVLPVPSTAQLQSGQTATTPFTLSSGLPLRVKYLSTTANMTLTPLNYNTASPAYSQLGLLPWLNLAGVAPQDFPQGNGLPDSSNYTTAVQDPYFDSFDDRGYSRVGLAFAIAGTSISLDKQTGSVISVGGFRQDWANDAVNSFTLAGRWSARNINYTLTDKLAVADLSGSVQVAPGQLEAIPPQPATPAFAFTSVTGPVQLPLQALSQAASVTDMTTVLKNAGFRGVVATATDITFSARFVFSGVSITEAYKSYMCQALRCTPLAQKALGGQDTDYFGGLTANVKFSLPLTP